MAANEIVKRLREISSINVYGEVLSVAADLIEQQQDTIDKTNEVLAKEGFTNLLTMISKYKRVMADANEISIAQDAEIEWVTRERDAAICDLRGQSDCGACKKECGITKMMLADRHGGCDEWEWRGTEQGTQTQYCSKCGSIKHYDPYFTRCVCRQCEG